MKALGGRKQKYRAEKQGLPVLVGEGHDFMVKIKVLPLAAQGQVVEDEVGQVHPAHRRPTQHNRFQRGTNTTTTSRVT